MKQIPNDGSVPFSTDRIPRSPRGLSAVEIAKLCSVLGNAPSKSATSGPQKEFTRLDVRRMLKVTERRLRGWENEKLIPPGDSFSFRDLLAMRALLKLSENHIPPKQIRLALDSLKRKLTDIEEPLRELRIISDGKRIAVQHAGEKMEALSGQLLFNFDAAGMENVRSLARTPSESAAGGTGSPGPGEADENAAAQAEDWFQRGLALEETGAPPDQAREAYLRAVEINPAATGALVNLGTIAFRARKLREAAVYYQRAIDADPRYPLAHFNLGNVFDELGESDTARRHYEIAVELNPRYGDALFNLALIAERRGDNLRAVKYWMAYLKVDNSSSWAAQARKQLERLRKLTVVE